MAPAEIAMEPPGSPSDGFYYIDPLSESRRFTGSERARRRTFVGRFAYVIWEINTCAVPRTESWETNGAFCWRVVYEQNSYPGWI